MKFDKTKSLNDIDREIEKLLDQYPSWERVPFLNLVLSLKRTGNTCISLN